MYERFHVRLTNELITNGAQSTISLLTTSKGLLSKEHPLSNVQLLTVVHEVSYTAWT